MDFAKEIVLFVTLATTVSCNSVDSPNKCTRASHGVDYVSKLVKLKSSVEFGGSRFEHAHVVSSGYITFGAEPFLSKAPNFTNYVPLVAAYASDVAYDVICVDQWHNESWALEEAVTLRDQWFPTYNSTLVPNFIFSSSFYAISTSNVTAVSIMILLLSNGSDTEIYSLPLSNSFPSVEFDPVRESSSRNVSINLDDQLIAVGYAPGNGNTPKIVAASPSYLKVFNFSDVQPISISYDSSNLARLIYSTSASSKAPVGSRTSLKRAKSIEYHTSIKMLVKSQSIIIPVRIPFGGCVYQFAQILSNGYIRLLRDAYYPSFHRTDYGGHSIFTEENPIIAPFAAEANSVVSYQTFDFKNHSAFNFSALQQEIESGADFNVSSDQFSALFVTFANLTRAKERHLSMSITAQAALITNGKQTFVMFNYYRESSEVGDWPGTVWPKPQVSIGFSFGLFDAQAAQPTIVALLPKSEALMSGIIDYDYARGSILGNTGVQGRWIFEVQNRGHCDIWEYEAKKFKKVDEGLFPNTYTGLREIKSQASIQCLPSGSHQAAVKKTVRLNQAIPFGTCSYFQAQVSSFGALALGLNADIDESKNGQYYLIPGNSRFPFIAPLSARLSSLNGSVCYSQHSEVTSPAFLGLVSSAMKWINKKTNRNITEFDPKYAFMVTWSNVTLPSSSEQSFQLMLATDGTNTALLMMHAYRNKPFETNLFTQQIGFGFTYGSFDSPSLKNNGSIVHISPKWPQSTSTFNLSNISANTMLRNLWYFGINTTVGKCRAPVDPEVAKFVNFSNLVQMKNSQKYASYQRKCFTAGETTVHQIKLIKEMPLAGCLFKDATISTNGWISFGLPNFYSNASLPLPFSDLPIPVFAPFYADSLSPSNDSICYSQHVYDSNSDDVDVEDIDPTLVEIRSRLRLLRKPSFHPTYALVVTYLDMSDKRHRQSPQQQRQSVTFQVAVFTDGVNTQFFYNYAPNNSDWSAAEDSPVFIGFSYGQSADRSGAHQTGNRSVSGLVNPSRHSNTGLAGVYLHEAPIFPAERCSLSTAGEKATSAEEIDSTDLTALLPSPQYAGNHTFANASCLSRAPVDDYSIGVKLPFPVPFGVHSHRIVHISTNGFILLSETPSQSLIFPRFEGPVFLPLNADYFADRNDSICWSMHSTDDRDDYFSAIDRHLANNSDYSILASKRHALVVTYRAMRVLGTERRLTFQFAMITNRTHLQFMFIYTANAAQEAKNRSFAARIGYSYGAQSGLSNYQTVLFNNLLGTNDSFGFAPAGDTGGSGTYLFSAERVNNGDCANRDFDCCDESDTPSLDSNLLPLAQHSECLPPADDASYRIDLNYAIEFGGCIFSAAYVSTNGYVTLGEAAKELDPEIHALSMPIFMPFAGDLTTMTGGSIWYSLHYRNDSYLRVITNCLELLNRSLSFPNLDFAVVITYYCVRDYRAPQRITFQLVLLCDKNGKLVAFYNYANSKKPWLITRRIQHGFSYGRTIDPFSNHSQVIIHASSSDFNTTLHLGNSAGNTGIRGVYFFEPELNITTNCQDINYGLSATKTNRMASASNLLQVSSNYSSIDCSLFGDDKRAFFNLTMPIEFGGCNYSALTVSTNGIIHLHNYDGKVIDRQPYFSVLSTDLYVPKGHLCVSQHFSMDRSSTSTSLSKDIDERLATLGLSPIATKYAIAVSYVKVMQYGLPNASFSFQFILFTDGNQTDFFFIYEESMELTVSPESRLLIGYSYGARNYTATAPYDFFLFYPPLLHQLNLTVRVKTHFGRSDYGTDYFRAVKMSQQTCD